MPCAKPRLMLEYILGIEQKPQTYKVSRKKKERTRNGVRLMKLAKKQNELVFIIHLNRGDMKNGRTSVRAVKPIWPIKGEEKAK
jgi:hypothetical protein